MTIEGILVGALALVVGAAFCFAGVKYFLLLLPIWGFLTGFVFGANAMFYIFGDSFLATSLAIVVGFVVAVVFAALAYLYYYFAIVILGGSIGYMLGIGVMDWLNIGGALAWIVGIIVGAAFAFAFFILAMPFFIAVLGTAIAGAAGVVAGLALILGRVPLSALNGGTIGTAIADTQWPWLWIGLGIVLAVAGAFAQFKMVGAVAAQVRKDQYRNPGLA